jgi:hypothetical protein
MMSKGALFVGVVALVACAGCASGPQSVAVDPTSGGDSVSPASPPTLPTVPTRIQRCTSGVYNRAADLCVSEGP